MGPPPEVRFAALIGLIGATPVLSIIVVLVTDEGGPHVL